MRKPRILPGRVATGQIPRFAQDDTAVRMTASAVPALPVNDPVPPARPPRPIARDKLTVPDPPRRFTPTLQGARPSPAFGEKANTYGKLDEELDLQGLWSNQQHRDRTGRDCEVRILRGCEESSAEQEPGRRNPRTTLAIQPTELAAPRHRVSAMKPLTIFEAEAEARWRWGGLFTRGLARYASGRRKPFEVGSRRFGSVWVRGRGTSWEAAFSNADTLTNEENPAK